MFFLFVMHFRCGMAVYVAYNYSNVHSVIGSVIHAV